MSTPASIGANLGIDHPGGPDDQITGKHLDDTMSAHRVDVREGDSVLIRTVSGQDVHRRA